MSHYLVAVFSRNDGNDVDELLAPFDENMRVDRYVSHTKEELIEIGKKNIQDYRDSVYAEYLRDPAKYLKERCENDPENRHYRYLRDEFPQRLSWTDEEIYQCEIDGYEPDEIGDDGFGVQEVMAIQDLDYLPLHSPCDLCMYNPPSSMDGKPCSFCPACQSQNKEKCM